MGIDKSEQQKRLEFCLILKGYSDLVDMKDCWLTLIGMPFMAPQSSRRSFINTCWVKVRCRCGREFLIEVRHIRLSKVKSCGCYVTEKVKERREKEGKSPSQNINRHELFYVWYGVKTRCYNKNSQHYHRYGGRNIKMCERWRLSFYSFLEDMGPRPFKGATLDRINNNGNYEPGNCRWATRKEQANNRG